MLKKAALREIITSLTRYLAILAIVALGVGFFAGLKNCKASMVKTTGDYLRSTNFYDYRILSSYGIDDKSVKMASKVEGVAQSEGSIDIDVLLETNGEQEETLKAISVPNKINTLKVVEGRLPEKNNECVIDAYTVIGEGYNIGDKVKLSANNDKDTLKKFKAKEFIIVGKVNTPIYMDYQRGSTDIGDGALDTFFYINKDSFDLDYYTSLYVKLEGDEEILSEELNSKLTRNKKPMEDLADNITKARRTTAMKEAQEKLDEKKQEYEDSLAEFEKTKADTERKLNSAANQISSGKKTVASTKKELNATIANLQAKKAQIEAGISEAKVHLAQANAKKTEIENKYAAGEITEEEYIQEYNTQIATINAITGTINGLKANLAQVNSGISKAKAGLETLNKKSGTLIESERTLNTQKKEAYKEFTKAERKLEDAKDKINEAQDKIDEMETGNSYAFSRKDNTGYSSFDSNSNIVDNIAKIFPVFFFLIAALVCMTTMTRMIDEQRTQIGVLKALGYSNGAILSKYMFYSGSAAFIGAVLGFFIGSKVFPSVIWKAYSMMYGFSDTVDYVINWKLGLISLAVAMICSMGATLAAIVGNFKVAPASLIRPRAPKVGKRILLERMTPIWNRLSFLYKVSMRNIFRDKKRFLMMIIGVSGCTALMIAGFGIKTSISKVADYQFKEISLYDYQVAFNKDMNADRQKKFMKYMDDKTDDKTGDVLFLHTSSMDIIAGDKKDEIECYASDGKNFDKYINLHRSGKKVAFPGDGEVVIVRKIQREMGINPGDKIKLKDGYREMTVTVSAVCDNYVFDNIFMSEETYEKGFGKAPSKKTALINAPEDSDEATIRNLATEAQGYEYSAASVVSVDLMDRVAKMMKSLNSVVFVVILCAALLAFIVLYNLTNINITERIREIATIKVLGFNQYEVSQYVFRENMFLIAIAAVVGMPVGKWLLSFVIDNIAVKMIYFEPRLNNMDYVWSVLLTFVFAVVVNLVMQRRLRNISMTESLKSVE
ncbi:MAG: FtsX-like permease family protein [Clostridiales bacterium]|nr:FtsX-like permease family protein [Clostridiales bacterium]